MRKRIADSILSPDPIKAAPWLDLELTGMRALRLDINPDISGGPAVASLAQLRLLAPSSVTEGH